MSRSYTRHPHDYYILSNNKLARSFANRCLRRKNAIVDEDRELYYNLREVSDTWCFPSDGIPRYTGDSANKLRLQILSEISEAINSTSDISNVRHWWTYNIKELCKYLNKDYSIETIKTITDEQVGKYVNNIFSKAIAK